MAIDLEKVTSQALQRALWHFGIDMTAEHCSVVVHLVVREMAEAIHDCAKTETTERWRTIKGQRGVIMWE
jgi:hypothetical protein